MRLYHHPKTRVPCASGRLALLPCGIVVEPSSLEAWLLIALDFTLGVPSNSHSLHLAITNQWPSYVKAFSPLTLSMSTALRNSDPICWESIVTLAEYWFTKAVDICEDICPTPKLMKLKGLSLGCPSRGRA